MTISDIVTVFAIMCLVNYNISINVTTQFGSYETLGCANAMHGW